MPIRRLEWDSRLFGYPVGWAAFPAGTDLVAEVRAALQAARPAGLRLLYLSMPPVAEALRQTLADLGATPVGCKVEFAKPVPAAPPPGSGNGLCWCRESSAALEDLALRSGRYSRFRLDAGFQNREFERLYREWLAAALRGDGGRRALVAGSPDAPRGLITLEPGTDVRIGLLAVAAGERGRGLGRHLVAEAERFCFQSQAAGLQVATQAANAGACRFYEACGFRRIAETEFFHAWFPPASPSVPPEFHVPHSL